MLENLANFRKEYPFITKILYYLVLIIHFNYHC